MNLALLLLTLAVVAAVVAIAMGRLPGGMPEPSATIPEVRLPDGPLTGEDVAQLRFVPALRGYRMDQVDDTLDRLAREVDRLRSMLSPEQRAELDAARSGGEVLDGELNGFARPLDDAEPDVAPHPSAAEPEPYPWARTETSEKAGR